MNGKKIVLFVSGSVAAYKAAYLLRLLKKSGADVKVVMTSAAEKFVSKLTFEVLSKNKAYDDDSYFEDGTSIKHIDLARWADLAIVAPATANFIAEAANGFANDFASTTFLAMNCPKFIAPAMNDGMLHNPATQRNIETLVDDGVDFIASDFGELAEGYEAEGRLADPNEILKFIQKKITGVTSQLSGKHVLITAGGTREQIDPVRFIGNNSSGKMGFALAKAAKKQGAEVTLVNANSSLNVPSGVKVIKVKSSSDLQREVLRLLPNQDVIIMAAAVSDFKTDKTLDQKIKKDNNEELDLKLRKTSDVISKLSQMKNDKQLIVGFAAETENTVENAKKKLANKKMDLIVLNDVSNQKIGFGSDDNQVEIISPNGIIEKTEIENKNLVAEEILDAIVKQMK